MLHQVLFLSENSNNMVPILENLFDEQKDFKMRFIFPETLYKSDFEESEFIILDYDYYLKNKEKLQLAFKYPEKLSIFAKLTDHQQLNEILKSTKVAHLFGMSGTHTLQDIQSYLVSSLKNEFCTPETFITPPETARTHSEIKSSENLSQQIELILAKHDLSNTFDEFKGIIIQILNETLTNALYNAPVDASGNFLHRSKNRKVVVTSDEKKIPTLDIVEDTDKIILSIKDYYGTLTKQVVDHYITHGEVTEKDGGAGIGMFIVLKHAHKVIINLDPGKMTEFIIVLHKFKRFYHYQSLEKSYHLYQRKQS